VTYRFSSTWIVPAPTEATFAVLADLPRYPRWWPQVRLVERIDEDRARLCIRSVLPYTLRIELRRKRVDRHAGLLEAALDGDLVGSSRWIVRASPSGSSVRFDERVELAGSWLPKLEPLARPAFIVNHALMMRAGRLGLVAAASGYESGAALRGA
jgi:hypothetical protein